MVTQYVGKINTLPSPEDDAASDPLDPDATSNTPSPNTGPPTTNEAQPPPLVDTTTLHDLEFHFLWDTRNGFNELSQLVWLWEDHNHLTLGSRFAHNLYCHKCCPQHQPSFLLSQEGIIKGCVWSMILCGIGLMPLAEALGHSDHSVLQPWYTNDFVLQGLPLELHYYSIHSSITG